MVLQTLRPFRTGVNILRTCDRSCDTYNGSSFKSSVVLRLTLCAAAAFCGTQPFFLLLQVIASLTTRGHIWEASDCKVVILTDLKQGIFNRIKCQELWKTEFTCIWLKCMWTSDFNCIPQKYMGYWKWCIQLHWWKQQYIHNIKADPPSTFVYIKGKYTNKTIIIH